MTQGKAVPSQSAVEVARPHLPFRWLGRHLCLDFVNTVAWFTPAREGEAARPRPEYERLTTYSRLVEWARSASVLGEPLAERLRLEGERDPEAAAGVLLAAIHLRAEFHRLFAAAAEGRAGDAAALAALNVALAGALPHRVVVPAGEGYDWAWRGQSLEAPLWPVVLSAAELLTSADVQRVRQCAGDDCGFLFLDTGRGPGRRWCDMAHCGNRAKARRHYRRSRGVSP